MRSLCDGQRKQGATGNSDMQCSQSLTHTLPLYPPFFPLARCDHAIPFLGLALNVAPTFSLAALYFWGHTLTLGAKQASCYKLQGIAEA